LQNSSCENEDYAIRELIEAQYLDLRRCQLGKEKEGGE